MRSISLDEIRSLQLDALLHVDRFCREKGLRYSLAYGSLIGAVRHGGFIPWDDDIDIMMPRPDYERFLKEFGGYVSHLRIQNYHTDNVTAITWTKICDTRTVVYALNMQTHVFIDVFPIDGAPDDAKKKQYVNEVLKRREYVVKKRKSYKYGSNKVKAYVKYMLKSIIYPRSRDWAIRRYEEYYSSFPFETSPNAGWVEYDDQKDIMPTDIFKNYTTMSFEGHEFMCIVDYDKFLSSIYGDYMTFPPKEQQVRGHEDAAYWVDTNK